MTYSDSEAHDREQFTCINVTAHIFPVSKHRGIKGDGLETALQTERVRSYDRPLRCENGLDETRRKELLGFDTKFGSQNRILRAWLSAQNARGRYSIGNEIKDSYYRHDTLRG